jgi:peptide deformylase
MKLDIVLWPDPVLLGGTQKVTEVDDDLRAVVGEMRRIMFELRGVGLAAPQVGVAKRLMLVCPSGQPGDDEVVINPEVTWREGSEIGDEGCLSFPDIYGRVRRDLVIRVRYQDLDLRTYEMELSGFVARVFLHELDHLDGRVFIDRMEPESRERAEDRLVALREQYMARADG